MSVRVTAFRKETRVVFVKRNTLAVGSLFATDGAELGISTRRFERLAAFRTNARSSASFGTPISGNGTVSAQLASLGASLRAVDMPAITPFCVVHRTATSFARLGQTIVPPIAARALLTKRRDDR
jgi:hypothetical protein